MLSETNGGYVKTEHKGGIATIEFFHPQSNSLPSKILEALAEALQTEGTNAETKVIVLRSAGEKVFCSGASFDELAAITNESEGKTFFSGFANVINAIRKAPQFIIARVQGKCVGGGVGIAAAADYAIATDNAEIKLSELAIGIGPFVVGPAVERKIGLSSFSQLAINSSAWYSADWAKNKGLYSEVYADTNAMDSAVERLAETLSANSSDAMKELKKVFWQGCEHWDELLYERAPISGRLVLSDYTKQHIAEFKAKMNARAKS